VTATRDRLREMTWEGFDSCAIGEAAGLPAQLVDELYDAETAGRKARAAIGVAFRRLVPDIDEVAIERVIDGDYPPGRLTVAERREAVRRLVLARYSDREIAGRLGVDVRTVCRIIATLGVSPPSLLAEGSRMSFRHSITRRPPWMEDQE
jgi:Homeodomain-like domain